MFVVSNRTEVNDLKKTGYASKMRFVLKSRLHLAAASLLLVTLIIIIHQMLSGVDETSSTISEALKGGFSQRAFEESLSENYQYNGNFEGEKLVHIDLKGAVPLLPYAKEMFLFIKRLGATGILLEYEDAFPYYDHLMNIPAQSTFNWSEVNTFLHHADMAGLTVMPLIQTFGHMEYLLKLEEYRELREVDAYPQAICPTNSKSFPLLTQMIDQVLSFHPATTHFHIGGDEVYHLAQCDRCTRIMAERSWSKQDIFLSHVRNISQYIRNKHPKVRAVMWDDEFRGLSGDLLTEFGLGKLVDIMIWKYTPNVSEFITDEILEKYTNHFRGIWIASAFKGATGASSLVPDVRYHLENHKSWMELVNRWKNRINFRGIALTGWQRYDHFGTLCELMPVAIPSLAACLRFLNGTTVNFTTMSDILQCDFPFAWRPAYASSLGYAAPDCGYTGSDIYYLVHSLYSLLGDIYRSNRDVAHGWLTWYQIIHNYSNPQHVEEATSNIENYKTQLQYLEERLRTKLSKLYHSNTVEEWISTHILPTSTRLSATLEARDRLLAQRVWSRRPAKPENLDKKTVDKICDGTGSLECSLLNF